MGRGIDSWNRVAKLHMLAGQNNNPMPTWFLALKSPLKRDLSYRLWDSIASPVAGLQKDTSRFDKMTTFLYILHILLLFLQHDLFYGGPHFLALPLVPTLPQQWNFLSPCTQNQRKYGPARQLGGINTLCMAWGGTCKLNCHLADI